MQKKQWLIAAFIALLLVCICGTVIFYQQKQLQQLVAKVTALQSSSSAGAAVMLAPLGSNGEAQPTSTEVTTNQLSVLQQQLNDLSNRLTQVEKKVGLQNSQTQQSSSKSSTSTVKEYIVFLGSGQTSNRDWTDISSAATTVNTSNYGQLKAVDFEAALSIIGGEAHARLKNQTTDQPIFQTEVFNNTSSADWITSSQFMLTSGSNGYVVQLRSSSGEMAILNGARIHLFLQ